MRHFTGTTFIIVHTLPEVPNGAVIELIFRDSRLAYQNRITGFELTLGMPRS